MKDILTVNEFIEVKKTVFNIESYGPLKKINGNIIKKLSNISMKNLLSLWSNSGIEIRMVDVIDDTFDKIWELCKPDYNFIANRSKVYLQWRFSDCPFHKFKIWLAIIGSTPMGYMVTTTKKVKGYNKGIIVDWLFPKGNPSVFNGLLVNACKWFISNEIDNAEIMLLGNERKFQNIASNYLFIKTRKKRKFLVGGGYEKGLPQIESTKNSLLNISDTDF